MTQRLEGRVALVTGAATGIGRATAERLAQEGAAVIAGIVEEGQRPSVATFDTIALDVRSEDAWSRAMAHVEERHGGLDILVNIAGIHRRGTAPETTREMWDEIMAVKLWGTFLGSKLALPTMRRRGGGVIINLCSMNALVGAPGATAYSASKGGILALTRAMAMEHVGEGIRVNCVCPGPVDTPIMDAILAQAPDADAARAAIESRVPMGRMATSEEIAAAIAFLASNDASYMTGVAVPVDGGRTVR
jgi:NAD(P)-dependent dehydrogenase (short-subunit alcohol dehydrogenase family)